jgi:hypothetical protein
VTDPDLVRARRAIALGKLDAFAGECWRLADLVQGGRLDVCDAVDVLSEADHANDLSTTFGADLLQSIMSAAFPAGIYGVPIAEAAA